ncbi:hypothetical protein [Thermococcus thermotolerans]|uniref:hypothetical protein n=1 Tax=Thermococcus thermotolerans TaxID=2969672 RepID=UPI00215834B6|nr:hypothetical protein [Thermococcus thermotolerans]
MGVDNYIHLVLDKKREIFNTDDHDLRDAGFEGNNQFLLYEWLVETVKRGKLEVLPSSVTLVKKELLDLEDGLCELIKRSGREEMEYVLIRRLNGYKLLVSVRESDLTDEEGYRDLLEDKSWFSSHMTAIVLKRISGKMEGKILVRGPRNTLKLRWGIPVSVDNHFFF